MPLHKVLARRLYGALPCAISSKGDTRTGANRFRAAGGLCRGVACYASTNIGGLLHASKFRGLLFLAGFVALVDFVPADDVPPGLKIFGRRLLYFR